MNFTPMQKIGRKPLSMIITDKLDGTNASVHITKVDDMYDELDGNVIATHKLEDGFYYHMRAASRKRWITPNSDGEKSDNFGFAQWVQENATELFKLGPGSHFGEWIGPGIQKNPYELDSRKFVLFNTKRWEEVYWATLDGKTDAFPNCVNLVRVLYEGPYSSNKIDEIMDSLKDESELFGTYSEGIVVSVPQLNHLMKRTFNYAEGKWKEQAAA